MVSEYGFPQEVVDFIGRVADSPVNVLISGERGTEKELVAKTIHEHSGRRENPFLKFICQRVQEELLESDLFGHAKGIFAHARNEKCGLLEEADGGTVFLDEIEVLPLNLQAKLLAVVQEGQIHKIGSTQSVSVDVRLITGTRLNLWREVEAGRFQADLFYGLNIGRVTLPPLLERREDILVLSDNMLNKYSTKYDHPIKFLSNQAREILRRYSFPGNIRELENTIERAVTLAQNRDEIQVWDLCGHSGCPYLGGTWKEGCGFCQEGLSGQKGQPVQGGTLAEARERFEREFIIDVLNRTGWSKTLAANNLGMSRKALWEKCNRLGISTPMGDEVEISEPQNTFAQSNQEERDCKKAIAQALETLMPYKEWPPSFLRDPQSSSLDEVIRGLVEIIKVEGPMVCHRAYFIYAKASGLNGLPHGIRNRFNEAIRRAAEQGLILERDEHENPEFPIHQIVRTPDTPEVVLRKRGPRPFDEIPPAEIGELMKRLLKKTPELSLADLIQEVATKYELDHSRLSIREKLAELYRRYIDPAT